MIILRQKEFSRERRRNKRIIKNTLKYEEALEKLKESGRGNEKGTIQRLRRKYRQDVYTPSQKKAALDKEVEKTTRKIGRQKAFLARSKASQNTHWSTHALRDAGTGITIGFTLPIAAGVLGGKTATDHIVDFKNKFSKAVYGESISEVAANAQHAADVEKWKNLNSKFGYEIPPEYTEQGNPRQQLSEEARNALINSDPLNQKAFTEVLPGVDLDIQPDADPEADHSKAGAGMKGWIPKFGYMLTNPIFAITTGAGALIGATHNWRHKNINDPIREKKIAKDTKKFRRLTKARNRLKKYFKNDNTTTENIRPQVNSNGNI